MPDHTNDKTQAYICDALIKLLLKGRPYHKISILDVASCAGIGRTTFYNHFGEIDDVIVYFFLQAAQIGLLSNGVVSNVVVSKREFSFNAAEPDGLPATIIVTYDYDYILKNRGFIEKVFSDERLANLVVIKAHKTTQDIITAAYKGKITDKNFYHYRYKITIELLGEIIAFLDWLRDGMPIPIEDMISLRERRPHDKVVRGLPAVITRVSGENADLRYNA
jgi:AcrR family transcriptional regulator